MEIIAAALAFVASFFAARVIVSLVSPSCSVSVAERLDGLAGRQRQPPPDTESSTVLHRLLQPFAGWLAGRLGALLPTNLVHYLEVQRLRAGEPVTSVTLLVTLLVFPTLFAGGALAAFAQTGAAPSRLIAGVIALAGLGLAGPIVWLRGRVTRRQASITRELPDALDLLVVSVEAGLGFEAAMARVCDHGRFRYVAVELRHVLSDLSLGLGRRRAMQGFSSRTGVPAVGSFVAAILQADQTGMGLGQVLRAQSEHLRVQRRQKAEETAMKAPLKMLFPLIFFIFPSLFVVVLAPAVLTFLETMTTA